MHSIAKIFVVALAMLNPQTAFGQEENALPLIVGAQESGTVQWELETIKSYGLDSKHGFTLDVRPLADSRAGQIALQAGQVDVILSDFVWVSIQRGQGNDVTMVPHSLAVGGLMLRPGSTISSITDLKGKIIGVAGGPVDKSWVTLQAYYNGVTGTNLVDDASANYGAPPLINELLANGSVDAALNFWQWNARAKVTGATEFMSVADMLSALGVSEQPPLLGWTFADDTATNKQAAVVAFLDASFEAKQILLTDDSAWLPLQELMGATGDDALFAQLRDDYRVGIVTHYDPAAMTAAEQAFGLMAKYGGSDLVGEGDALDEHTFWRGYSK